VTQYRSSRALSAAALRGVVDRGVDCPAAEPIMQPRKSSVFFMEDRMDLAKLYQFWVVKMLVEALVLFVVLLIPDPAGLLVGGA